jgi:hypothetical protein
MRSNEAKKAQNREKKFLIHKHWYPRMYTVYFLLPFDRWWPSLF